MTTERIADHIKFAYWVPNVSGGLVTSDIEQRTDWNYEYNTKLAQTSTSTSRPASHWHCCWPLRNSR
jgi:hypothetical protein